METVNLNSITSDPRQVAIIRQACLKASCDFMSGKLPQSDIDEVSEKIIALAIELEKYVYHGRASVKVPDIDVDKYMKKEDKK